MGGLELLILLALLLKGGSLFGGSSSPAPTASAPVPGPAITPPRTPPAATVPAPGAPATPQQARAQTQAANMPAPFPQAVPPGLPPFPGPKWTPFANGAVSARAFQLLPTLWATGPGTKKQEQTSGSWMTYVAAAGPAGRKDVHAFRLIGPAPGSPGFA